MKYKLLFILIFFYCLVYCQNEANIWYFGQNAGLDFNSGSPVALTDGQMVTQEGCASIADVNGNLQFYTDGSTIWNKNHAIMQNGSGLNGHFSSTQSAIIVPKPGTPDMYYVFTVDYQGGSNGLQYSEVDTSLNAGLGAVTANKNIMLLTPVMEKLTAVQHANGNDIWVIAHKNGSAEFYAYLVTNAGIQSPVITAIGESYGGLTYSNNAGYMKVSPDGSKLAAIYPKYNDGLQLFDFDNATGILSNYINVFYDTSGIGVPYGVEFSPSGELIYVSGSGGVSQFDLTLPSAFQILLNATKLHTKIINSDWGALQLGPDGKIYITREAINGSNEIHALSVINNPDDLGLACDFQLDTISLSSGVAKVGLPPFIQSYFLVGFKYDNVCFGDTTQFEANISQPYDSLLWDFGDGFTSTLENPTHTYAVAGTYNVTLSVTSGGITNDDTQEVIIYEQPVANLAQDMIVCDNDNDGFYSFDLTTQDTSILNGQDPNIFVVHYYSSLTDYNNNIPINDPTNYVNTVAYTSQIIYASVQNRNNNACKSNVNFDIRVFENPVPSLNITKMSECDSTSFGTDTDGMILFDLTTRELEILNGQNQSDFTVTYFTDALLSQQVLNPNSFQNTSNPQTIYAKVENNSHSNCYEATSFEIEVLSLPNTQNTQLTQCDDDLDGFSNFNLNEAISKITNNAINETITFYESFVDADLNQNEILNITSYTNQTVSSDTIWARVENSDGCYRVSEVNLLVSTTQIPVNFQREFYKCDDDSDGDMYNGIATFDFSSVDTEIRLLFPAGQQLTINYYETITDALAEMNEITDISNYSNLNNPYTQNIYVRVDSDVDNSCLGLGHHITLHIETVPIAHPMLVDEVCDADGDGLYEFDTSTYEQAIVGAQTNVIVEYYDSSGAQLPSPLPNPFVTGTQDILVRVINNISQDPNGACFDETTISFNVQDAAVAYPIADMIECDFDNDGLYEFDTSLVEDTVLNGQNNMIVSYFDENGNQLSSPLPNPFMSSSQTIRVRVENPLSSSCFDETTFRLQTIEQPHLQMNDVWTICEGGAVEIFADTGFDEYLWSTGETTSSITVYNPGTYEVTVANTFGGVRCEDSKTITVLESNIATITNIETEDWTFNENTVTILVEGKGDYEYSIDGVNYQDSNIFTDVSVNQTIAYVRDKNGCGIAIEEFYLMYYPKFFTPNNDGYHDTWNLYNASNGSVNSIKIYDRYGKLLKELNPNGNGWDGTFNGSPLPSSDYWFMIQRQDGKQFTGHFSLRR